MDRRDTVHALPALAAWVLGLAAAPGLAQKQAQAPRVGILVLAPLPSITAIIDGMRSSMRDQGYVEGSSIQYQRQVTRQNQSQSGQAQDEQLQPALSRTTTASGGAHCYRGKGLQIKQDWG